MACIPSQILLRPCQGFTYLYLKDNKSMNNEVIAYLCGISIYAIGFGQ